LSMVIPVSFAIFFNAKPNIMIDGLLVTIHTMSDVTVVH
jgi:hypothetical protein